MLLYADEDFFSTVGTSSDCTVKGPRTAES